VTEVLQDARATAIVRIFQSGFTIAIAIVVFALLLLTCLFPFEVTSAVRIWLVSPTFNHCALILPLSLFMVWQRRRALNPEDISPTVWAIMPLVLLTPVWLVAWLAGILEAQQFAMMTILQAVLLALFGPKFYRKLAGPLLYLYFLIPSGAFLIPPLQAFTANFAVMGLHVLRIPVFSTGAVIDTPTGTFAVAEACAGLRFLIASLAFGVFFAIVTYRSLLRRALFVMLSVVLPIVANGFRVLGLIAAAQWVGSPSVVVADHVIYGWMFFSIILVALVALGHLFSDRHKLEEEQGWIPESSHGFNARMTRIGLTAGLCALVILPGPLVAAFLSAPELLPLPKSPPRVSPPWRLSNTQSEWKPVLVRPTRAFSDAFVLGGTKLDRYVAVYAGNSRTSNLVRSASREADEKVWTFDSASSGELNIGRRRIPVRISTWLRGSERRKVWSFYVVGGEPVASSVRARMDQLLADLTGKRCLGGYVALSMDVPSEMSVPSAPANLLATTEPLGNYLCSHSYDKSSRAASKSRP
jgi:exosortase A